MISGKNYPIVPLIDIFSVSRILKFKGITNHLWNNYCKNYEEINLHYDPILSFFQNLIEIDDYENWEAKLFGKHFLNSMYLFVKQFRI